MKIDIDEIMKKHKVIISKGIKLNEQVKKGGYGYKRTLDIIDNMIDIIEGLPENTKVNVDACIIAGYWLDVGVDKSKEHPEKVSADKLSEELAKENYDKKFIKLCYDAIIYHRWNMLPSTVEGQLVKDADKISFIGVERWKECIEKKQKIDLTMKLLATLRNQMLHFNISKQIYDEKIVDLVQFLYNYIYEEQ